MTADWAEDVVQAVERWAELTPGRGGSESWRCVGHAVPHRDGWLMLDLRDGKTNPDLIDACLAGERGPNDGPSYPIDERRNVDGVVMLRAPAGLPSQRRYVWARSMSARFLVDKLRDGLAAAGEAPLARALAEGRLSRAPTTRASASDLLPAQAEAFRACLSPGVRLVWGPPGTGKTRVLASAIEQLVRADRRVLLVSTANVAVDNALRAVLPNLPNEPGVAVRVGTAHDATIATNPNVQLELLAATRSRSVDARREMVAQQLREFDELDAKVADLQAALSGYDDRIYRTAVVRLAAERELEDLFGRAQAAEEAVREARDRDAVARADLADAQQAYDALDVPRHAVNAQRDAAEQIAGIDRGYQVRQARLDVIDQEPEPHGWRDRISHRRRRNAADAELRQYIARTAARRRELLNIHTRMSAFIQPTTAADLEAADDRLAHASAVAEQAAENLERWQGELEGLNGTIGDVRSRGLPSEDDRRLVAWSDEQNLPARYTQLQQLLPRQRSLAGRRSRLEKEHRELVDEARKLRRDAESAIINRARVVATTLARSRAVRAIAAASFDVVLVDEAGAVTLAEVLLALCRSTTTAVLFGDFLQLGPVLDTKVQSEPNPLLDRWVRSTCFSHVGINGPRDIPPDGRCVALTHQFRFGPALRRLANDVIYDVLADADVEPPPETEIVLVDVSTVPDLAAIRVGSQSGQWWTAGVLLSRALAEQHAATGPVGIVTPYRVQWEATLAALRDRKLVAGTAAGTVHSFQGREFPTVVFDLVDDGHGWIAQGRRGGGSFHLSGVKLFGVGITRARRRLYLIVDGQAVKGASAGPIRALRAAVERGEVRRWSAAALLGRDEPPPERADTTFVEVARLLQRTVTITDIHDEHSFASELERQLDRARATVWMWSPWIANRARRVVPLIKAAVDRGVEVTVFMRPDDDRNMSREWAQRRLAELRDSGANVIRSELEHRKVILVDGERVLVGSANALSNTPGTTREVMITIEGRAFAERMHTELRVDDLGKSRPCPRCRETMEVRRGRGRRSEPFWHCRPCDERIAVPQP